MKTLLLLMAAWLAAATVACTERTVKHPEEAKTSGGGTQDQRTYDANGVTDSDKHVSKAPPRELADGDLMGHGGGSCRTGEKHYDGFGCEEAEPDGAEQFDNLSERLSCSDMVFVAEVVGIEELKPESGYFRVYFSKTENIRGEAASERYYSSFGENDGWYLSMSPYIPLFGVYVNAVGIVASNTVGSGPEQFIHTFLWIKPDGAIAQYPAFGDESDLPGLDAFKLDFKQSIGPKADNCPCCWGANGASVPETPLPGFACSDYTACQTTLWEMIHIEKPAQ